MEKIITQCSGCQAKFKLDEEKLGKKIKCPKCQTVFVVEEVGEPAKPAPAAVKPAAPAPKPAPVAAKPAPAAPKAAPKPAPAPEAKKPQAPAAPKPAAPAPVKPEPAPAAAPTVVPLKDRPRPLKVADFFETQAMRFMPEKAEGVNAQISYDITGEGGGQWSLSVHDGKCDIRSGADPSAKTQVTMKAETYLKLALGKLDGRVGFMLGKIKIKGDKGSIATVRECFKVPEVQRIESLILRVHRTADVLVGVTNGEIHHADEDVGGTKFS